MRLRLTSWLCLPLVALGLVPSTLGAGETNTLAPQLEPFRPYLGRTFRGEFKDSTTRKPLVDVSRWERALNGQAIRTLHSLNDGAYGGETLVLWNAEKKSLVYHYFTTAGFTTTGTMTFEGTKITSHEYVTGDANGVTEVKAVSEFHSDGSFTVRSQYLKAGKWEPGHEATYREDPKAEVKFR